MELTLPLKLMLVIVPGLIVVFYVIPSIFSSHRELKKLKEMFEKDEAKSSTETASTRAA